MRAHLIEAVGIVLAVRAARGQVREDVGQVFILGNALELMAGNVFPGILVARGIRTLREVAAGNARIRDLVEIDDGFGLDARDIAHERDGHVLDRLANPQLLGRVVGVGHIGEDGRLGRRLHDVAIRVLADDLVNRVVRAGRVVVVGDRGHEIALEVVLESDLGIDGAVVVDETGRLLVDAVGNLGDRVDEAADGAAGRACGLGLARQVGKLVVDLGEVTHVVGLLGIGVELARTLQGLKLLERQVDGLVALDTRLALGRSVFHVVGLVGVEDARRGHVMDRDVKALAF